jgi:hypothetical protein
MKYEISALRAVVAHIQSQYPMKMRIYEFLLAVGFLVVLPTRIPKKILTWIFIQILNVKHC